MIEIEDIISPDHVRLALKSSTRSEAIQEVLQLLKNDPRIRDWDAFQESVLSKDPPAIGHGTLGICIAHTRTNAVGKIVAAVGRSTAGVSFPDLKQPVKLVFVIGIPAAMDSEYLRLVGAIARTCQDGPMLSRMLSVGKPKDFIEVLAKGEKR